MTDQYDLRMEEMRENHEIDRWKFENEMEKLKAKNPGSKSGDNDMLLYLGVAILGSVVTAGVALVTQPNLLKGIVDFVSGLGKPPEPEKKTVQLPPPPPPPEPLRLRPKYMLSKTDVTKPIGNPTAPQRSYRFQMRDQTSGGQ